MSPSSRTNQESRALVELKLGRLDRALADYDQALVLSPNLAGAPFGRGIVRCKRVGPPAGSPTCRPAKAMRADIAEEGPSMA